VNNFEYDDQELFNTLKEPSRPKRWPDFSSLKAGDAEAVCGKSKRS
jgi:hypothetical protein